jgi:hypothetical protein
MSGFGEGLIPRKTSCTATRRRKEEMQDRQKEQREKSIFRMFI